VKILAWLVLMWITRHNEAGASMKKKKETEKRELKVKFAENGS